MMSDPCRHWTYPGARWWKFDLHTHKPSSKNSYWHRHRDESDVTPERWLQRFIDADMVHVLGFHGQCYVRQQGSLLTDTMREEVCRVMEDGREAFERRYRRLGTEPPHVR